MHFLGEFHAKRSGGEFKEKEMGDDIIIRGACRVYFFKKYIYK